MASATNFLTLVNGVKTLVASISAFTGNANEVVSTNGSGFIDPSLLPAGIGAKTATVTASGALAAGDFVNVFDNAGTLTAQLADESTALPANAFVLTAIPDTTTGLAYFSGINNGLSGLTAGLTYYLSTAGGVTTTVPSTEDGIIQCLGTAVSATELCAPDGCAYCVIDLL